MYKVGTLRFNDAYGNKNVKKKVGFITKTTTLHVYHAFCTFLCPFLHDYDVKMPNLAFYGDVNNQRQYLISLSVLGYDP